MQHTVETPVTLKEKTFYVRAIEDVDYLLEVVKTDDDVPFWAVLWPAAVSMSEYFWENVDFNGLRVLELGAGLGLAGIVAAAKGASTVQTDFIPESQQLAKENAEINGISNISYRLADWRNFPIEEQFDRIIGSDILYEPKLHPYLEKIFMENLKPGGTVIIADPGREDAKKFIEKLSKDCFCINTVTRQTYDCGHKVTVSLYFLTRQIY